jgi:hypothetical protein
LSFPGCWKNDSHSSSGHRRCCRTHRCRFQPFYLRFCRPWHIIEAFTWIPLLDNCPEVFWAAVKSPLGRPRVQGAVVPRRDQSLSPLFSLYGECESTATGNADKGSSDAAMHWDQIRPHCIEQEFIFLGSIVCGTQRWVL